MLPYVNMKSQEPTMNRNTIRTIATGLAIAATAFLAGHHGASANEIRLSEPGEYVLVNQYRALDTRTTSPIVAGNAPAIDIGDIRAAAVAVSITITNPNDAGFVTAWADGPRPNTSVLTIDHAGQTQTGFAIVPVNPHGEFRVFVSMDTDVIVDVVGYISAGPDPYS